MTGRPAALVIGPALPTLDDVAREFPRWHCWRGVAGLLYARLTRSSPPVTVRSDTALGLRAEIRQAQAGPPVSAASNGATAPGGVEFKTAAENGVQR